MEQRLYRRVADQLFGETKIAHETNRLALEMPSDFMRDARRLAACIAVLLLIVWSPYIFFGKTLLTSASEVPSIYPTGAGPVDHGIFVYPLLDPGAPGWANEPWLALQHRLIFDEHVLPMWNPYSAYGTPFAASMQGAPFYPLSLAVAVHPAPWTYNFLVIGRLFILGLGCALFVRMFAGFTPALVAGICAIFSGYFLLYLNMGHIAVEVMLAWTLLGVELAIRKASPGAAAVLAVAWALTLIGGMPESAALAGLIIGSYAVVRIISSRNDGPMLRRCVAVVSGIAVGSMIAGIMLAPFLEYLGRDSDDHQSRITGILTGVGFDHFNPGLLLTDFSPLALGPPLNDILTGFSGFTGARGAPGVFAIFCSTIAAIAAIGWYRRGSVVDRVVLFMVVVVAILEAKRFGVPFVNWIGALPVLQLIEFTKYEEAPIAVLCACLAGFGVAAVLDRKLPRLPIVLGAIGVLGAITWLSGGISVPNSLPHANFYYRALLFTLAIFAVAVAAFLFAVRGRYLAFVSGVLVALAVAEGTGAYLIPMYYIVNRPVSDGRNPYVGAPYITYLQHQTQSDGGRIIGADGELFPDWAGAFGVYDTRDLDAMYPQRYLPFVAAFLYPSTSGEAGYRFTGRKTFDFGSELVRRWMALSSIEYAVAARPIFSMQDTFLNALWTQTEPTVPAAYQQSVRLGSLNVNGTTVSTLFEHPPYSNVQYTSTIEGSHPWLAVDLTLDPAVWNGCGGPVTYQVSALNAAGTSVAAAARMIDPKHNLADRRLTRLTLDLRKEVGQPITLRFATSVPTPADTCAAWAHWAEPRWTQSEDLAPFHAMNTPGLTQISGVTDATVYRVDGALPRLVLFHGVREATSGDDALRTLTGPAFDYRRTAVIEGSSPRATGDSRGDNVQLIARNSQRVEADVTTSSDAVLMQNDTWYPGWKATVDGRDVPILVTDYLFRGIEIPAGRHRVVIAYRSLAVNLGLAFSLIGVAALLGMLLLERDHGRKRRTSVAQVAI